MSALTFEQEWDYGSLPPDQLPRGRHRNPSLARWRRVEAVRMATAGATCQEIADRLALANRGTVSRMLKQTLARHEAQNVEELRHNELEELRRLRLALAPKIAEGHVPSIMAAMATSDRILRLHGLLDGPKREAPKAGWDNCGGPPTVVVRADDCRHSGCPVHGAFDKA